MHDDTLIIPEKSLSLIKLYAHTTLQIWQQFKFERRNHRIQQFKPQPAPRNTIGINLKS